MNYMRQAMRRRIIKQSQLPKIIALSVIGIILLYSVIWYVVASHIKTFVTTEIDHFAQENGITFNYSQLKIKGYPFNIEVQFEQPKLLKKIATLIDEPASDTPATPSQETPPSSNTGPTSDSNVAAITPEASTSMGATSPLSTVVEPVSNPQTTLDATYEFFTDDKVGIRSNLLAKNFSLIFYGDTHYILNQGDKKWHTVLQKSNAVVGTLKLTSHSLLQNIFFPNKYPFNVSTLSTYPFVFNINAKDFTISNAETKELLQSGELTNLVFHQNYDHKNPSVIPVRLILNVKNYESTPAYDLYLSSLAEQFPVLFQTSNSWVKGESHLGKSNLDFDVELTLPSDLDPKNIQHALDLKDSISIIIHQADFSNALGTAKISGLLDVKLDEKNKENNSFHVVYHSTFDMPQKGYEFYINNFKETLTERLAQMVQNPGSADMSLVKYLVENPDSIQTIIPKFHELGTIQTDVDITVKGPELTITQADFISKDYTIKLQGNYQDSDKMPGGPLTGKGKILLQVNNYKLFTADAVRYLSNLFAVYNNAYQIQQAPIVFSDAFKTDLDKVLLLISDAPNTDSNDLTITVQNEGDQLLPTVGTLPLFQAAAKAQELLEPHFVPAATTNGAAPTLENTVPTAPNEAEIPLPPATLTPATPQMPSAEEAVPLTPKD